jgi:Xaa-Pro aminopeptidase
MRRRIALLTLLALPAALSAQAGSPAGPVPVANLQARREALFARIGKGIVVLRSAEERSIEAGGDHPQDSDYREDNDFFYLTGIESPESYLVLVANDTTPDLAILYIPPRNPQSEQWTGYKLSNDSATALSGITEVHSADSAESLIRRQFFRVRGGTLFLKRSAKQGEDEYLRGLVFGQGASLTVKDIRPELAVLRQVKDADEIRRLRGAINATTEAQRDATANLKPTMWEYQLEAIIESAFRRNGAERVGFPSIVGSGPNSVTLHYDKSRRQMQAGDLVVVDIGAEWGYHSADVTRTYPVSGKYTPRQRQIYDLVLATQQAAIDSVRPGMTLMRLSAIARDYMKAHSGTLCGTANDCTKYFIHGLSHWLGMDVHDVGNYQLPFAPGMVLTVEPGIYIPEENLGVRIEDDILVTATGHENLSEGAPRNAADIEKAMAGNAQRRPMGRR